jgi:cytidylate kinase
LFYRAITWMALERCWDESDPEFGARVRALSIDLIPTGGTLRVVVDGQDPGAALHAPRVTERVSSVASLGAVRDLTLDHLRRAARERPLVCDGRDIGTEVFPDAEVKVFLVADAEERATRRLLDLDRSPTPARVREETRRLRARDRADSSRERSPLRQADDAVELDSTHLTIEEVTDRILALCRERGIGREDPPKPPGVG